MHRSLAHAVVGVQMVEDGGCIPHWQSRLLIRSDAHRLAVRKLVKPHKVAGVLPLGPQRPAPDYKELFVLAAERTLDASMLEWLRASRLKKSELSGDSSKFHPA